jgi:hypothetical protein
MCLLASDSLDGAHLSALDGAPHLAHSLNGSGPNLLTSQPLAQLCPRQRSVYCMCRGRKSNHPRKVIHVGCTMATANGHPAIPTLEVVSVLVPPSIAALENIKF